MDINSSSDLSDFSGYSDSERDGDYHDPNNGVLYSAVETHMGTCISITFFNQEAFDKVFTWLTDQYVFQLNKAQTGQTTTTKIGNGRVVVTLYKTNKILIQGKEARMWRNTVFKLATFSLDCAEKEETKHQEDNKTKKNSSQSCLATPQLKKNKSKSFLSKVSKVLLGPQISNDVVKLGREIEKAQKKAKSGKLQIDQEELTKQLQAIQTTGVKPKTKLHKTMVKSHSYSTKQRVYTPVNYKPKVQVDETEPKPTMIPTDLLNDDEADIHQQNKAKNAAKKGTKDLRKGYRPVNWQFKKSLADRTVSLTMNMPKIQRSRSLSDQRTSSLPSIQLNIPDKETQPKTVHESDHISGSQTIPENASQTNDKNSCKCDSPISLNSPHEETQLKTIHIGDDNKSGSHNIPDGSTEHRTNLETSATALDSPCETDSIQQHTSNEPANTSSTQMEIMEAEIRMMTQDNSSLKLTLNKQSKDLEKQKSESGRLRSQLESANTEIEKRNQITNLLKQEVDRAAAKIADLTAKTLILEDENSKLSNINKKINADIKQIKTKIDDKSSATENGEKILSVVTDMAEVLGKITTGLDEVKNKVNTNSSEADILLLKVDIKNTLSQQISGLKTSITTGTCPNQPIVVDDPTPRQTTLPNATETAATKTSRRTGNVSTISCETQKAKHIYILGDTVTNVLNQKKLSGDKYSVTIKTTQGARISQIKSNVQTLSTKDTRLTTCDAVLLHSGIHNISDAQSTSAITEQYKDLISTVKNVNKKAHIILSSILPKKEDKLSAKSIKDVNQQIKDLCKDDNQVQFMDNTPQFINNNSVNQNLYRNDLELSYQGAARLAKNIMSAVNTCLKTGYNTRPNSSAGNFQQSSLQKTTGQHQEWRGGRPTRPQQRPDPRRTWSPPRQNAAPWTWTPPSQRAPPRSWIPPNQRAAPQAWAPRWMPRWAPPPPPGFY